MCACRNANDKPVIYEKMAINRVNDLINEREYHPTPSLLFPGITGNSGNIFSELSLVAIDCNLVQLLPVASNFSGYRMREIWRRIILAILRTLSRQFFLFEHVQRNTVVIEEDCECLLGVSSSRYTY